MAASHHASAATFTWNGAGGNNLWNTAANWGGTAPANNGTAALQFGGNLRTTPDMNANYSVLSLTFNVGASAFTLGSTGASTLTIQFGGITNSSTNTQTINNAITLAASQTWNATSGGLVIGGNVNTGGLALTIGGASNTSVGGIISNTGTLTKSGAGTLTLSAANTYSGTTTVSAGILTVLNTSTSSAVGVLGSGAVSVAAGATLRFNNANTVDDGYLINNAISGAGSLNFAGPNGAVTTLNVGNTYFGGTLISSGIVNVNSNTALGTGTVTMTGGAIRASNIARTLANNFTLSGVIGMGSLTNISGTTTLAGNTTITASENSGSSSFANVALGAFTLATGDTGPNTYGATWAGQGLTISGVISGTGGITQGSVGSLTLSGPNTFTGATTVNAGTLIVTGPNSPNSTLGTSSGITINNGGTISVGGDNALAGITTSGAKTIQINAGGTLTIGSATAHLHALVLNGGTLSATTANPTWGNWNFDFGVSTPGTGNTSTISGGNAALTQTGGSIFNVGSNDTINVSTVLAATTSAFDFGLIKSGAGTLTLSGANTFASATKVNAGILNIQNATGLGTIAAGTTVSSGATLQLQGGIAVGAESLSIAGTGATGQSGALVNVSGTNSFDGLLTLTGATTLSSDASTLNLTNSGTITGATFGLTLAGAGNGSLSSIIGTTTGTLTKSGAGTWTLSGANTYTGATAINAGTLAIQNAGALGTSANTAATTIAGGASLQISNNIITTNAGTLILNGTGGGSGALQNLSGNNTWNSDVTIASNATIFSSTAANMLTIGNTSVTNLFAIGANTVTFDGAGDTWVNSNVGAAGDTGSVIKNGTGRLIFYGTDSNYTGTTTVNAGSLELAVGPFSGALRGINGPLTIGTGPANPALAGTVSVNIWNASYDNQISSTANVTINSDGALNLGTTPVAGPSGITGSTTMGSLILNGGQVNMTSALSITPSGGITSNANSAHQTSLISGGTLNIGAPTTFTVARDSTITSDLTVSSIIAGGSITKLGAGVMTLSGANTYTGTTTVSAGVLNIQNASALGDISTGTSVSTGAALQIQGNVAVGAEALTLNGNGISNDGALRNVSGNNSYAGAVMLGAASTIAADAGTSLTLSGTLTNGGFATTFSGAGNITASNAITGTGALVKSGSGTTILSGPSTYTGTTTVTTGVLNIQNATALGSTAGNTTVFAGTALQIQGNIAVGNETLRLNGSGIASDGALRNISGNNSWAGPVTIISASTIASDAGTLTIGGNIATGGFTTTFAGAGNIAVSGIINGTGGVTKTGAGTLTLNSAFANNFTGNTTVSGGTLAANADGALAVTPKVTINSGGTVLLGTTAGNDRIGNTSEVALAGGTLNTGGFSETVGKMTLSANSTLDLGAGASVLTFDGASSLGTSTLSILNWSGTQGATGGTDQVLFTNSSFVAGTTSFQVQFNVGGTFYAGKFVSLGGNTIEAIASITPVPEPTTIFGASALVLAIAWRERKRFASMRQSFQNRL